MGKDNPVIYKINTMVTFVKSVTKHQNLSFATLPITPINAFC